ncbi:MAG: precorrin-4 C(11)-methyltransferase [Firmicutes bacterium]|nr:precorrin-4 C(11)-methyltransferase [Bacillota bacterium]
MKVYFIGAGPGDPELVTLKAVKVLQQAEVIIYAGSLVNPEVLCHARQMAEIYDSAPLPLEEIMAIMEKAIGEGKTVARVHTGDPSLYGAIQEQMDWLDRRGIPYEVVPGVSSFLAAAASLKREYTIPGVSQTVIISRLEGRTGVPEKEALALLARHRASLCIFLSVHLIGEVVEELKKGYPGDTPVAVVEKASWPEERVLRGRLEDIERLVKEEGIRKTALILVGDFLLAQSQPSKLYHPGFQHGFRGKAE